MKVKDGKHAKKGTKKQMLLLFKMSEMIGDEDANTF